ncbi:MAG: hypothetical protein JWM47_302 [Acidimicrobiales bacterium]|nr:hypothetical protein [Acidimicrobiales bacterium]
MVTLAPGTRHPVGRDAGIRRLVSLHRRPSGRWCCFSPDLLALPSGQTAAMTSLPQAQLSAISSGLDEIVARVAALGEELDTGGTSDTANALFEAERALKMAARALSRARRSFGV